MRGGSDDGQKNGSKRASLPEGKEARSPALLNLLMSCGIEPWHLPRALPSATCSPRLWFLFRFFVFVYFFRNNQSARVLYIRLLDQMLCEDLVVFVKSLVLYLVVSNRHFFARMSFCIVILPEIECLVLPIYLM